jgi:hypothetical protein
MDKFLFADEAGNFDFARRGGATSYFILTTVAMDSCDVGERIMRERRAMVRDGLSLEGGLHASEDAQKVRDRIFDIIAATPMRIDAIVMEKAKAQPQVRRSDLRFYKYGWLYLLGYVAPRLALKAGDELCVTAASLGIAKKRKNFRDAIDDVMTQTIDKKVKTRLAIWPAEADPCLVVADYCTWAIQRKWESGDDRSHKIIASKISSEFDLWQSGTTKFY